MILSLIKYLDDFGRIEASENGCKCVVMVIYDGNNRDCQLGLVCW